VERKNGKKEERTWVKGWRSRAMRNAGKLLYTPIELQGRLNLAMPRPIRLSLTQPFIIRDKTDRMRPGNVRSLRSYDQTGLTGG
jgi:hypothetical protein